MIEPVSPALLRLSANFRDAAKFTPLIVDFQKSTVAARPSWPPEEYVQRAIALRDVGGSQCRETKLLQTLMTKKFSRQELYELVWAEPTRSVAATIGVSDVALAKACRKADIPLPPRGYWIRKSGHRAPPKTDLPLRFPGAADEVEFGARHQSYEGSNWRQDMLDTPVPPIPVFEEALEAVAARIQKIVGKVPSQKSFDKAFGDIGRLLSHDEERRKSSWQKPLYETGIEQRRLLIINSIYLAVHAVGCKADMSTSKYSLDELERRGISVRVGEQHVHFTLEASGAKGWRADPQADPKTLVLSLGSAHSKNPPEKAWRDGDDGKLETKLREVVCEILLEAERQHRERMISHRQWIIERKNEIQKEIAREKAELERKVRELLARREKERMDALLNQASDIKKAQTIREYVEKVRARSSEIAVTQEDLSRWATWALAQADRIDPVLSRGFLELLPDPSVSPNGNEAHDANP